MGGQKKAPENKKTLFKKFDPNKVYLQVQKRANM